MPLAKLPTIAIGVLLSASVAAAQATPFLFSTTPAGTTGRTSAYGYYEVGYGERTFEPVAGARIEQAAGLRAALGSSVMVLARAGVSDVGGNARVSPRAEVLLTRPVGGSFRLAGGVGYAREYSRTNVMLARLGVGRMTSRSAVSGDVVIEKPTAGARDGVDLISSVAAGRRFGSALTMSVEAVGQDLEGFWDPAEKDGGARLMVGPSVAIAPPAARWQLSVGGGPVIRATSTTFASTADRPLPKRNGYVLRSAVGFRW
jgi:hypothetical protein